MSTVTVKDLLAILPFLLAVAGGILVIFLDALVRSKSTRKFLGIIALFFLTGMIVSCFFSAGQQPQHFFSGMVSADDFGRFLAVLFAIAASLAVLMAMGRLPSEGMARGEFYALLMFSTGGATLLVQATDLVSMFIGLETLSIPAYILAATLRRDPRSAEAGLKYFVLGSFATGFLVYGMALLYGSVGSTEYTEIARRISNQTWTENPILILGALFVLVGFLFKIAAVPFHMWAPDVYQGSPTPATAFFATAVKSAALAALLRLLFVALPQLKSGHGNLDIAGWYTLLQGFAVATMTVANLVALVQTDVKRMLAYSSIAHAGYLLIGLVGFRDGGASMLFYLLAYTFMTAGAFALVAYFEHQDGGTAFQDYKGLSRRHPLAAVAFSIFLFSLAGIPPTAGFFAKFYLFRAAVRVELVLLVVIAVLNSLVSATYYLRVMVAMYMEEPALQETVTHTPKRSLAIAVVVVVCALLVLAMGIYPSPYLQAAGAAMGSIGGGS